MKKQNLKDLRNKTVKDLNTQVKSLRKEISNLIIDLNLGKLKNPHAIKSKKKEIAQVLTLINYKSLEQKLVKSEANTKISKEAK